MQATVYNLEGQSTGTVELNDAVFGIQPNMAVVHQAVLRQQANRRLGTHNTLTRADVRGGGHKPWRQKGTGRARQGSTRSPQWRHGGVVFGPHPRSYEQDLPRKMRRLAARSVLSSKAQSGQILLIDSFADLEPRTKAMIATLARLNLTGRKVLIMTPTREQNLELAAGNIKQVRTMMAQYLNLTDMLTADVLVISRAGVEVIEGILSETGGRKSRPVAAPETVALGALVSPIGDGAAVAAAGQATNTTAGASAARVIPAGETYGADDTAAVLAATGVDETSGATVGETVRIVPVAASDMAPAAETVEFADSDTVEFGEGDELDEDVEFGEGDDEDETARSARVTGDEEVS